MAEPERLLRFLLLTFADLKKSAFLHWFAFPTLGGQALFRLRSSEPAAVAAASSSVLGGPASAVAAGVVRGLAALWARSVEGTGRPGCPPFFVIVKGPGAAAPAAGARSVEAEGDGEGEASARLRVLSLLEFETERVGAGGGGGGGAGADSGSAGGGEGGARDPVFGFIDPCSEPGGMPGWPLRNFLVLLSARWGLKRARVLCFREHVPRASSAAAAADGSPIVGELVVLWQVGNCSVACGGVTSAPWYTVTRSWRSSGRGERM